MRYDYLDSQDPIKRAWLVILFLAILGAYGLLGQLDYEDEMHEECARLGKIYNPALDQCEARSQ